MEALDLTPNGLKEKGYTIRKERATIAVYFNGSCKRSSIYKNDGTRTINRLEKELEERSPINREDIEQILACASFSYDKIMNGAAATQKEDSKEDNQTETPIEKLNDISPEEWQAQLSTKYNVLQDTIQNSVMPLPQLPLPLEFALSIKNVLNLADCTLPFAGFMLGVPSSLKTVVVELFRPYWHTKYSDDFSPKAFVSHYSGLPKEELEKIDLLPKIRFKFFLTPELAPLFTGNEDDIRKAFGNLTRILDGKGFETDSGTQGERGYHGNYMFTWLGAAVDVSSRVHRIMGGLGPKMYFLRLPKAYQKEKDLMAQLKDPRFLEDLAKIQKALFDYLKWFEASPVMEVKKGDDGGFPKIVWDSSKDDENAIRQITRLAILIGHMRGVVDVDDTKDTQGSNYGFTIPTIEEPNRANQQLYNLARGHALIEGRNCVTPADIPLLIKVVLSTAPITRVAIFEMLLASGGTLWTTDIMDGLGISKPTVHKAMAELELLELVDVKKDGDSENSPLVITLKDRFRWCLGSRFRQLRGGFSPARKPRKQASFGKRSPNRGDNMKEDSIKRKEIPGFVTHNTLFFWDVFNLLEKQKQPEPDGTVRESELKQVLISSGKFNAGEAAQLVNDAIEQGLVKRWEFDVIGKNSSSNISKSDGK